MFFHIISFVYEHNTRAIQISAGCLFSYFLRKGFFEVRITAIVYSISDLFLISSLTLTHFIILETGDFLHRLLGGHWVICAFLLLINRLYFYTGRLKILRELLRSVSRAYLNVCFCFYSFAIIDVFGNVYIIIVSQLF